MKTQVTLEQLAARLADESAAGTPDPERVRAILAEALRDREWLDPRYAAIPDGETYALFPVYRDPARRCSMLIVSLRAGVPLPIHNHGAWAVIGVYRGRERETRYVRLDDRRRPGHASLVRASEAVNETGSVVIVPDGEIHSVEALDGLPAISLHVYGTDIVTQERSTFDIEHDTEEVFRPTFTD